MKVQLEALFLRKIIPAVTQLKEKSGIDKIIQPPTPRSLTMSIKWLIVPYTPSPISKFMKSTSPREKSSISLTWKSHIIIMSLKRLQVIRTVTFLYSMHVIKNMV